MILAEQRCRNHEQRAASCRCPRCRRYFCRECVTEHEDRLLCAGCLRLGPAPAGSRRGRAILTAGSTILAGVLCWLWFLLAAEVLVGFRPSPQTVDWEQR